MQKLHRARAMHKQRKQDSPGAESILELALAAEILSSLGDLPTQHLSKIITPTPTPTPATTPRTKRKRQSPSSNSKKPKKTTTPLGTSSLHFHPLENSFFFSSPAQNERQIPNPTATRGEQNSNALNTSFLPANFAKLRSSGSDVLLLHPPASSSPFAPSSLTTSSASTNLPGVSTLLKGTPSLSASSFQLIPTQCPATTTTTTTATIPQQPLMFHHHVIHPPQHAQTTQKHSSNHNGCTSQVTKRRRRKTSAAECAILRAAFDAGMYHPPLQLRKELAAAVNMTERQIQVWFQNRRQKLKKGLLPTVIPSSPPSSQRPITIL